MKQTTLGLFLILASIIFSTSTTNASPWELDKGFGTQGIFTTSNGENFIERYMDLTKDSKDRIVAVGYLKKGADDNFLVSRFLPNGKLDADFVGNGSLPKGSIEIQLGGTDVAQNVLTDEKDRIYVAGNSNGKIIVIRFTPEGNPDLEFGVKGKIELTVPDGTVGVKSIKLLKTILYIAGTAYHGDPKQNDFAIFSIKTSDGSANDNFGNNGKVVIDLNSTLDAAGSKKLDSVTSMAILEEPGNYRIYLGGYTSGDQYDLAIAAIDAKSGALINNFGKNGVAKFDVANENDLILDMELVSGAKPFLKIAGVTTVKVPGQTDSHGNPLKIQRIIKTVVKEDGTLNDAFGDNGFVKMGIDFEANINTLKTLRFRPDGMITFEKDCDLASAIKTQAQLEFYSFDKVGLESSFGNNGIATIALPNNYGCDTFLPLNKEIYVVGHELKAPGNTNVFLAKIISIASESPPPAATTPPPTSPASSPPATDTDGDGVVDTSDNCDNLTNADQKDDDTDGVGNVCDPDFGVAKATTPPTIGGSGCNLNASAQSPVGLIGFFTLFFFMGLALRLRPQKIKRD